jgi:hypothetical protein
LTDVPPFSFVFLAKTEPLGIVAAAVRADHLHSFETIADVTRLVVADHSVPLGIPDPSTVSILSSTVGEPVAVPNFEPTWLITISSIAWKMTETCSVVASSKTFVSATAR